MKKKIYSVSLIVAVAMMVSSCNGCKGNTNNTSADSLKDSSKQDSQAKDSTFPKTGPKGNSALSDSAGKKQDASAQDSTFPKTGPKGKVKPKPKAD